MKRTFFSQETQVCPCLTLGCAVWECSFALIGIFPKVWPILALNGVDIICHPSNLVLPSLAQRAIHALTSRIYVVTANRTGSEEDQGFTGMATIADPKGEDLAQDPGDEEDVPAVKADSELARKGDHPKDSHLG
jgi:predicted amidohydrolase